MVCEICGKYCGIENRICDCCQFVELTMGEDTFLELEDLEMEEGEYSYD